MWKYNYKSIFKNKQPASSNADCPAGTICVNGNCEPGPTPTGYTAKYKIYGEKAHKEPDVWDFDVYAWKILELHNRDIISYEQMMNFREMLGGDNEAVDLATHMVDEYVKESIRKLNTNEST